MSFTLEERTISRKYLKSLIKIEVECSTTILDKLVLAINKWLDDYFEGKIGKRYLSKDIRLKEIKNNLNIIDELALTTLYASLTMKGETLQELIALVVSQVRTNEDEWLNIRNIAECVSYIRGISYDIYPPNYKDGYYTIKPLITLSSELAEKLTLGYYLPPAIRPLEDWTTKYDGGYHLSKENCILGDYFNNHDKEVNIKVLNTLQRVGYELTSNVDEEEVFESESSQARDEFEKRLPLQRWLHEKYRDKTFYFVWQFDKRGRVYDKGYDIHIQGNSYRKASLQFAKKEKLTARGIYWLKVDLANNYGLDKLNFDDRVKWVDENIDSILKDRDSFISKADEPLLFKQALEAYEKGVIKGQAIGHITRLDATCSGPQLMSTIMRDEKAMKLFNVLGDSRVDYYTLIAKEVANKVPNSNFFGTNPNFNEVRKVIKPAIMTFYYNSLANPKSLLGGEQSPEYKAFIEAMKDNTSGALNLMDLVNTCFNPLGISHSWTLPDGHYAYCPVTKVVDKRIELHELGSGVKVTYRYESNEPNKDAWRSLMPNLIHSLDGWICRMIVLGLASKDIEVSPIHDSFGVHPNYCDELRKIYRGCLSRLYQSNLIDDLLSEIVGKKITVNRPEASLEVYQAILNNTKGHYLC